MVAKGVAGSPSSGGKGGATKLAYDTGGLLDDGTLTVGGKTVGGTAGPVATLAPAGTSDDGALAPITVIADRHQRDMLWAMTGFQYQYYRSLAGDVHYSESAAWKALSYTPPQTVNPNFSSYDSPLLQSLKSMPPSYPVWGYCGPAPQYMLGDGSVVSGSPATVARYQQQRAAMAGDAVMARLTSSPVAGIAYGYSRMAGASPATQDLLFGLGSAADGLTMAYGGTRGATIPGNNSQNSLSVEATLRLRYMPEWTAEQRAAADLKVGVLDLSDTTATQAVRGGYSARSMFARENGPIGPSYDIDHLIDLQLGGSHTLTNLWPLDSSVNRSLGSQVQNQIQGLPLGTKINRVTIGN